MSWPFSRASKSNSTGSGRSYGTLLDSAHIVLTISTNRAALILLQECTADTYYASGVGYPNYPEPFFLKNIDPGTYPEWTWSWGSGFKRTRPELVTDTLRTQARLITEKVATLGRMMFDLSTAREKVWAGVSFQETVYATKRREAQNFRDSGYDEGTIMEYPFVLQYADFANLSLQAAADEILLKAKLDDQYLANTELLRLRYFEKVRRATKTEELATILEEFLRDYYLNAKVA